MKNVQKFVRDSNFSLNLLTFQLSNVGELETIQYSFALTYAGSRCPRAKMSQQPLPKSLQQRHENRNV